jgi:hypothetical protein
LADGGLVAWINITGAGNIVRNNISSSMNTIEGTSDHNIVVLRSKYINYFVDPDNQDYHLKAGSPAIDAGIDSEAPETDLDKAERPQYGATDVGAFEYYDGPDTLSPSIPAHLTGKNPGPYGFTLSWSASNDNIRVSAYDVYLDGTLDTTVLTNSVILTGLEDSTTYTLKVVARDAANNFSEESDPLQVTTLALVTGIKKDPAESGLPVIYPNPVNGGEFTVHADKWEDRFLTIEITDAAGRIIYRQSTRVSSGGIKINNTFRKGIYVVRINDGFQSVSRKLLIK